MRSNAILRGTWDGKALTDVRDIFVSDDVDTEASRIAFGKDGMLYMGIGGPGTGPPSASTAPQHANDLRRQASAPARRRQRAAGQSVCRQEPATSQSIYPMGHRVQLGLTLNPYTGEIWEAENGPNGGDEVNVLRPGKNYGWPIVSYGRDYLGPRFPPSRPVFEEPVVFWVPSIALVGPDLLHRRPVSRLEAQPFVGGMREGEMSPTGQLQRIVFNDKWEELRRESLLRDLHQRIRDVRQGPDGLLYLLTDEDQAALVRIEPVAPASSAGADASVAASAQPLTS